jgi:hypothetical protein
MARTTLPLTRITILALTARILAASPGNGKEDRRARNEVQVHASSRARKPGLEEPEP